jgi:LAO/AO transport system kinase
MRDWLDALLGGNRRALARVISYIEDDDARAAEALAALYPRAGRAYRVGVTGAGGTGKSTLVSALTRALRARGDTVGIIAIDPTSPFTGGALLGDRVRMLDLAGDPGVFIRSMATRGALGGLARAASDAVVALDAAGFDVVLVETVGAGQGEVEIAQQTHTTVVVEAPGLGDAVQAIKAGLMEIADVLAVNKADRPGAGATVKALRAMLDSAPHPAEGAPPVWLPPVVQTVATTGEGVDALLDAIDAHRAHLLASGSLAGREREQVEAEIVRRLREALTRAALAQAGADGLHAAVERVLAREEDPGSAARRLMDVLGVGDG